MDIRGERFEKGCWVGGMGTASGSVFCRVSDMAIGGSIFRGTGGSACDALQDGLPSATGTDTDLAVSGEEGMGRVVAGAGSPLCPTGRGREGRGLAAEFGEELTSEIGLYAEKGEEAETKSRVGMGQGGIGGVAPELGRTLPG